MIIFTANAILTITYIVANTTANCDSVHGTFVNLGFIDYEGTVMSSSSSSRFYPMQEVRGIVAALPLWLGICGALVWIIGETVELTVPGSALIKPVAGLGIVGTALLPFGLLMGQDQRAVNLSFLGAFGMTAGAFLLGIMNLMGQAPTYTGAATAFGLYDVGGVAYIVGSFCFALGLFLNGQYNRVLVTTIGVCAFTIILMFALGLPQRFASISNIVLAIVLITLAAGLLRPRNQ